MKKLVVHIGYHKTGTTFLNRKFFANHPDFYHMGKPYSGDNPIRELIERLIGLKRYDANRCKTLYDDFVLPVLDNKIVTISDGRIIKQNPIDNSKSIPERLLDITDEVIVIVVIRRQYEYLKSLYVQHIGSNNEKRSFNEWFDSNWEAGGDLKFRLDYFERIKTYIDVLGRDNVGIFLYEQLRDDPDLYLNNLCSFIGCDCSIFDKESDNTKPLNQRMTTLHRLIHKNPILYFVADIIKRIIPKMAVDVIRSYIFIRFNRYQPELSSDRIKLVQAHAHTVNENLIRKMTLDLRKYKYE
jgi:hypothetical protein